jgi:hypothetical protein
MAGGGSVLGTMKFHATVIFEFNAHDVGEAGERLNELLAHAAERRVEAKSLELATPPGMPVSLPSVAPVSGGAAQRPHT